MIDNYWLYICIVIILEINVYTIISIFNKKNNLNYSIERLKIFEKYETLLALYTEKAYQVIYKDHIMVYSVEGMSPKEEDIVEIQKLYLSLLLEIMGPKLVNEMLNYYGNDDALYKNALIYFDSEYENDAIKKSAIDRQLSQD